MFPPPFTPAPRPSAVGGHTALLELFTGSGCPPCVAADDASEALLKSYSRDEVVVLEEDQHIPEPDPLANPDTVGRADFDRVLSTPSFMLDGKKLPALGGTREESETLYGNLTKMIDAEQAKPSPVKLILTAHRNANGQVDAKIIVVVDENLSADHRAWSSPTPSSESGSGGQAPMQATVSAARSTEPQPKLVVNFALVEDNVRYSGENGIRFHRMVVRSLFSPADQGQAVAAGSTATLSASFDAAAISVKWAAYLSAYEMNNERYGRINFLSKDTTITPSHLAVAAWVQDSSTHHVYQAAFIPVPEAN